MIPQELLLQLEANRRATGGMGQSMENRMGGRGFEPSALIAEGGGLGGALAGGAAGAAIGSAVPVIGTAIGGLIGAGLGGFFGGTGGSVAEQKVRDNNVDLGKALKFGAIEGVTSAGPIKLLKAGKAATTAARAGTAVVPAVEKALSTSLLHGFKSGVAKADIPAKMFAQAFTVPRRAAATLKPQQTARELIDYGVNGSLDSIKATSESVLKNVGGLFDNAVAGIGGDIKIGDPVGVAKNAIKGVKIPKADLDVLMQRVTDIGTDAAMPGFSNPSRILEQIRDLERYGYSRINAANSALVKNPDMADLGSAYVQVAKELEDSLYGAMDSVGSLRPFQTPEVAAQLNSIARGLGDKFVNAKSAQEVRSLMAPFVRARNLVSSTMDESSAAGSQGLALLAGRGTGAGAGFAVGGVPGAAAGFVGAPLLRGVEESVRAPISTKVGGLLNRVGQAGSAQLPSATGTAARAVVGAGVGNAVTNSPQATAAESQDGLLAQMNPSPASMPGAGSPSGAIEGEVITPGSAEWYLHAAQRAASAGDIESAETFMKLATSVADITKAQTPEADSTVQASLSTVGVLENLYQQAGGAQGRLGGRVQGLLGSVGLASTRKTYEDQRMAAATQIARAFGESRPTDQDIQRILRAIPTATDTPQEAQLKFSTLRELLSTASGPQNQVNDLLTQMSGGM